MTSLEAALRQINSDLVDTGASFALIGGLAVSVRTEPRFTRDADLPMALPSDDETEALIGTLLASGYEVQAIIEQAVGRAARDRQTHPLGEAPGTGDRPLVRFVRHRDRGGGRQRAD